MGNGLDAVRRVRPGRRIVGGAVLLVAVLALGGGYALTGPDPVSSAQVAGTAQVDRGVVATAVATTGSLEPAQRRSLSFAVAGAVTEVTVRPGDQVTAGQLLARIDDASALDRTQQAQDTLDSARQALDTAEQGSGSTSAGSTCLTAANASTTGQTVALSLTGTATTEVVAAASTAIASATPDPTATGTSTPTPTTSAGTVTPTATASATATPTPSPAPTPTPTGRSNSGGSPGASTAPQPGARSCANGGSQAGGTDPVLRAQQQVNTAELALAEAQDALAGTRITAPITGKVLSVAGPVGTELSAGRTFVTVADIAGMQVAASFPEADAGRLANGQTATVTLANRPGEEFPARVVQVSPVGSISASMVTYRTVLAFDTVPGDLLVGQSAKVTVTTGSVAGVLRVPSTAVHATAGDTGTVRVKTASGAEDRQVGIGLRGDTYTEIRSGISEGAEVVTSW